MVFFKGYFLKVIFQRGFSKVDFPNGIFQMVFSKLWFQDVSTLCFQAFSKLRFNARSKLCFQLFSKSRFQCFQSCVFHFFSIQNVVQLFPSTKYCKLFTIELFYNSVSNKEQPYFPSYLHDRSHSKYLVSRDRITKNNKKNKK